MGSRNSFALTRHVEGSFSQNLCLAVIVSYTRLGNQMNENFRTYLTHLLYWTFLEIVSWIPAIHHTLTQTRDATERQFKSNLQRNLGLQNGERATFRLCML